MNGLGRGEGKEPKEKNSIFTRETLGMTLLLFSALAFVIAVTRSLMFGDVGIAITAFLLGCFGYLTYPVLLFLIAFSVQLVSRKKFLPRKWLAWGWTLVCTVFFIVHLATSRAFLGEGYGKYLAACFTAGKGGVSTSTGGGIIYALTVYPIQRILSVAGAYVVFSFAIAIILFFFVRTTPLWAKITGNQPRKSKTAEDKTEGKVRAYPGTFEELAAPARTASLSDVRAEEEEVLPQRLSEAELRMARARTGREILFGGSPASSYRDNLIYDRDSRFNRQPRSSSVEQVSPVNGTVTSYQEDSYQENYSREAEQTRPAMPRKIQTQSPIESVSSDFNYPSPSYRAEEVQNAPAADYYRQDVATPAPTFQTEEISDYEEYEEEFTSSPHIDDVEEEAPLVEETPVQPVRTEEPSAPSRVPDFRSLFSSDNERLRGVGGTNVEPPKAEQSFTRETPSVPEVPATPSERFTPPARESRAIDGLRATPVRSNASELFDSDDEEIEEIAPSAPPAPSVPVAPSVSPVRESRTLEVAPRMRELANPMSDKPAPAPKKRVIKPYRQPSLNSFHSYDANANVSQEEIDRNSQIIVETLAGFRVDAEVVRVTCGSSVTRYDIDIPGNVLVASVIKRDEEIAMRLHAKDGVNIYSNSEVGAVSIEVPNAKRGMVGIKPILLCEAYKNAKPNSLMFAIGKDVEGRPVCGNIVKMKHVLVAGATGSGKSVCLNSMLISLICKYSPQELRLILIDPKKIEFAIYEGLPHLMINEVIADAQKAVTALNWAIKEMERRYQVFETKTKSGTLVRNIDDYNANLTEDEEKLPKIVVVIDELADLMSVAKKDIEERVQRLTQKARAAGIHLIIATQRPSVDVITGVIKGNLPTRMAFRVIQEVDSRTILDESGAQKLLGLGDMLYRTEGMYSSLRVQGAFLDDAEVQAVVKDIKDNNEGYFDEEVADYINNTGSVSGGMSDDVADGGAVDPMYLRALAMVVKLGTASISLIQRKCSVGYNHAGKIVEWMDAMGYISPFDGKAKARTVLLSKEDYESKYGSLD